MQNVPSSKSYDAYIHDVVYMLIFNNLSELQEKVAYLALCCQSPAKTDAVFTPFICLEEAKAWQSRRAEPTLGCGVVTTLQEEYSELLVMSQRVGIKWFSAQQNNPKEVKYGLFSFVELSGSEQICERTLITWSFA